MPWLPALQDLPPQARATAGVALLTAWCWLTEALPLPIASLLPACLLPLTGVVSAREVATHYFHDILLLLLGGFILALALERHGLHRRFAFRALRVFGTQPRRLVLGFMVPSGCLSLLISNTSTALLMLPVAVAVLESCKGKDGKSFAPPLLLGIAYACSLGGVGTPIGTAPNGVFLGQIADRFPDAPEIGFGSWLVGTLPFVLLFLGVAWLLLTRVIFRLPSRPVEGLDELKEQHLQQGPRTPDQNRVALVFGLVALAWVTRQGMTWGSFHIPGWEVLLPASVSSSMSDATVALVGVFALFLVPSQGKEPLMDWKACRNIPWGILLLLGGGFALAKAVESSGLSASLGAALGAVISQLSPFGAVFAVVLGVTFLTEVTSNTATINLALPLLFSAALAADLHPFVFAVPATMAVSCAFMLPVATPPNAILFSSGLISIRQMARAGFLLNLTTAILATLVALYWTLPAWGIQLDEVPSWAWENGSR